MFLQRIPFQHHRSQTRTTSRRRASRLVSSTWQYLAILLAGFLGFIFPSAVQGASLTVCANGCQYSTIGTAANELEFPALMRNHANRTVVGTFSAFPGNSTWAQKGGKGKLGKS